MHLRGEPLRPLTGWLKSAADFDAAEAAVLQHHTRDQVVVVFHEAI